MLTRLATRAASLEKGVVAALCGLFAGIYAFVEIAENVVQQQPHDLDIWLLRALREPNDLSNPIGPQWFEEMMRDFTALGGTGVLALVTLGVTGFLAVSGKKRSALMVLGSIVGALILSHSLKWGFDRPRPELVPHGARVYTQSFPSGHAMLSTVVYLTLGMLLARTRAAAHAKVFVLVSAAFLALLVGSSRVYLGVHWPSDVLAGWAIGGAWAFACWLLMYWLQRHGDVEAASHGDAPPESPRDS